MMDMHFIEYVNVLFTCKTKKVFKILSDSSKYIGFFYEF